MEIELRDCQVDLTSKSSAKLKIHQNGENKMNQENQNKSNVFYIESKQTKQARRRLKSLQIRHGQKVKNSIRSIIQVALIYTLLLLSLFLIYGCGPGNGYYDQPPGIYGAQEQLEIFTPELLESQFQKTKTCTDFEYGKFSDLKIQIMNNMFECGQAGIVHGCFSQSRNIQFTGTETLLKWASMVIFRHEVIHFLMKSNKSYPDIFHKSDLFMNCVG